MKVRLRGPCVKYPEPALESCVTVHIVPEIQRNTGVNGKRSRMSRQVALIRVVPPSLRSLTMGMEALFISHGSAITRMARLNAPLCQNTKKEK